MSPRRRTVPLWALFAAFVVMPLVELYVLVQVGQVVGAAWTIGLLVVASLAGGWLIRREGSRAWAGLREALGSGRMPARELADGILVVVGGALMLAPGFVTDAVAVLLVLPATRPFARRLLTAAVARRLVGSPYATHPGRGPQGPVVRGDVVE